MPPAVNVSEIMDAPVVAVEADAVLVDGQVAPRRARLTSFSASTARSRASTASSPRSRRSTSSPSSSRPDSEPQHARHPRDRRRRAGVGREEHRDDGGAERLSVDRLHGARRRGTPVSARAERVTRARARFRDLGGAPTRDGGPATPKPRLTQSVERAALVAARRRSSMNSSAGLKPGLICPPCVCPLSCRATRPVRFVEVRAAGARAGCAGTSRSRPLHCGVEIGPVEAGGATGAPLDVVDAEEREAAAVAAADAHRFVAEYTDFRPQPLTTSAGRRSDCGCRGWRTHRRARRRRRGSSERAGDGWSRSRRDRRWRRRDRGGSCCTSSNPSSSSRSPTKAPT